MNSLLNYFIEANLYLISIYLMYELLLARDKHFQFNRAFVLSGIALSLLLPLVSIPVSEAATPGEYIIMLPAITIGEAQQQSVTWLSGWWQIILIAYIAGGLISAFNLSRQLSRLLRHLPFRGTERQDYNGYTVVATNGEIPTCSFFRYLFWDKSAELTEAEKQQILDHEITHIKQWHSADILLTEVLRVVFWFNPAVYMLKSRLTEVHEYIADRGATSSESIEQYSILLTQQVFKEYNIGLSNHFHNSQILKRITMLKTKESKSLWRNIALLLPMLAMIITVFSCETGKNETQSETKTVIPEESSTVTVNPAEPSTVTVIPAESSAVSDQSTSNKEDSVFIIVDIVPEPVGGMTAFYEFIGSNLKYPEEAKKVGIEGKVFIEFVTDEDGKITNVVCVRGIGHGCDEEAVRVIKIAPAWKPGEKDGKKVKVRIILPITYKLG